MIEIIIKKLQGCLIILLIASGNLFGQPLINSENLSKHIYFLASEELAGRYPGTSGDESAANYILNKFNKLHFQIPTQPFQNFELVTRIEAGDTNFVVLNRDTLIFNKDFVPLSFSTSGTFVNNVIFAGYGISIKEGNFAWDDYKNVNVKNKWVLLLRGEPFIDSLKSPYMAFDDDRNKVMQAKDEGAYGVILVSGENFEKKETLKPLKGKTGSVGIPVIQITRSAANALLPPEVSIEKLENELNSNLHTSSYDLKKQLLAKISVKSHVVNSHNVYGILEGNDSTLKNEYVIIGAHYDHLGMGGEGSSSRRQDTIAVHYGADDNASGVAAMLEIADKFSKTHTNKRSIIFVSFGAEEQGLVGSKYFVENLPVPAKQITAMVNLDMVGRLNDKKSLQISGTGTSTEAMDIINSSISNHTDLQLSFSPEGYGPSDHASFYGADIPVFYFTTGGHGDYHTPADQAQKINYEGLRDVSEFVYQVSEKVANYPTLLTFHEAGPKTGTSSRSRTKITLGLMPNITSSGEENGMGVDFVTEGKPAQKGGMLKGDVITSINGKSVKNIYDYMYRLSKLETGETISIEVSRNGEEKVLIIQL